MNMSREEAAAVDNVKLEEEIDMDQDFSTGQNKLVWDKESIAILLKEYLNLKKSFNACKGPQERKVYWDIVKKKLHDAGFTSITSKHIVKKFCHMKRVYKEFRQGLQVGQRLYGFLDVLADILDDDPYISDAKPTKRMMQTINRKILNNVLNGTLNEDDVELASSLPPWVTYMVSKFTAEEMDRRDSRWKIADEVLSLEKKKLDCLESLIITLKGEAMDDSESRRLEDRLDLKSRKSKSINNSHQQIFIPVTNVRPKILRRNNMIDISGVSENELIIDTGEGGSVTKMELLVNDADGSIVGRINDGEVYQVEGYLGDGTINATTIDLSTLVASSGFIIAPDDAEVKVEN